MNPLSTISRAFVSILLVSLLAWGTGAAAFGEESGKKDEKLNDSATLSRPMGEESASQTEMTKKDDDKKKAAAAKQPFSLESMVITATRTPLMLIDAPRSLNLVEYKRFEELNPLVAINALRYDTGIWLEHRTSSTADPILRGFAGQNLLALVDGNTLSTLWGEGGEGADDMYGKIDPDWVDRIEVIRGPASVLYGSNAIGGVLNIVTRDPALDFTDEGFESRYRLKGTYGSASKEYRLRSEIHGSTPTFRFMLGGSLRDIDNLEGGRGEGTLKPTDSEAANWDFTSEFIPFGKEHKFRFTYQNTNLNRTKRYYKPNEDNFSNRDAYSLDYSNTADNSIWDELEMRFYYQNKLERRRWLYGPDAGQRGIQKTITYTGDIQLTRNIGDDHRLAFGLHYEMDDGESPGDEQVTLSGPGYSQKYKNTPDSVWQDYGVFLQDEWDICDQLTLIAGARYDGFDFRSNPDQYYVPPLAGQDPNLDQINSDKGEFSGGLGLTYHIDDMLSVYGSYARGYRLNAPNFGITLVHSNAYRIPNGFLDPMIADQYEVGVKAEDEGYSFTADTYYTVVNDAQREEAATFDGSTFYDANGNSTQELANDEYDYVAVTGGGKAVVKGVEFSTWAQIDTVCDWFGQPDLVDEGWSMRGGFSYEKGQDKEVHRPVQFTHPVYGYAALRYDFLKMERPIWVELDGTFVRKYGRVFDEEGREWLADPADANSGYLRDYIGTPGYTVLDLRGGREVWDNAFLTLAVENLTDKKYRSAHSRMDAPGINFVASLDIWF